MGTSDVKVCGNEIADGLAREGSHKDSTHRWLPYFSEISYTSQTRCQFPLEAGTFRSGHTRAQRYVMGLKVYSSCLNCNVTQATPAYILACIGCHKSQLLSSPTVLFNV
ncbi:hypothetical protein TNCV_1447591 [Trichonephila clavipes]|nr:hypothetical protein TNCV_1447591 [Trichonephila clavipes]